MGAERARQHVTAAGETVAGGNEADQNTTSGGLAGRRLGHNSWQDLLQQQVRQGRAASEQRLQQAHPSRQQQLQHDFLEASHMLYPGCLAQAQPKYVRARIH